MRNRFLQVALLGCLAMSRLQAENPPLRLTGAISLPGVKGRIDHLAFDAVNDRLFVCALGNNSVEIIDLGKGVRIHSIAGLGSPQGVAYIPAADRLLVTNDRNGLCKIYDGKSFQQVAEINLGDDADNVRYDESTKKVYVGFGNGGLAVIGADGKQTGSIQLSGHPEAFELEKNNSRIFVNVPNSRHVAVVDRDQKKVIAEWKTGLAFANFPMALDETNHRLFVGCRLPSKLIVLNTDSGEVVSKIDIPSDADDVFYDTKRHRIYVICGAGTVEIIDQKDANGYRLLAKVDTAGGARTGIFVPHLDKLFVAVPDRGTQQAEIRAYRVD